MGLLDFFTKRTSHATVAPISAQVGGQALITLDEKGALPYSWRGIWEAKRLPDPGTGNYAWETEMRPLVARDGAGQLFRVFVGTEQPMMAGQTIVLVGIPLTAGQIDLQPLYDPNAPNGGYAAVDPNMQRYGYNT